jgi:hypothetical protein
MVLLVSRTIFSNPVKKKSKKIKIFNIGEVAVKFSVAECETIRKVWQLVKWGGCT